MKFIKLDTTDAHLNLAIEEHLFNTADEDIFMLWQNSPTVVIGRNQNAYTEIDMKYAEAAGIRIARRITGGGAVYHDLGNLNYTFISEGDALDFARFSQPIISALGTLGVKASLSGRNDLEAMGRKFSGNAQHVRGGKVLHHGTLLFNSDLSILDKVLNTDKEKLKAKAVKSNRARVINLCELLPDIKSANELGDKIFKEIAKSTGCDVTSVTPCEEIEALYKRNSTREWLFPERDLLSRYSLYTKKKYPFGLVEIFLEMKNDIIADAKIRGDFFGTHPISELEGLLVGKARGELCAKDFDGVLSSTVYGMSGDMLLSQIFED